MTGKNTFVVAVTFALILSTLPACEPGAGTEVRRREPVRQGYMPPSKAIYHPDWRRRKDAVDVLAEARDNRSLALLSIALKDKDPRVRMAAIKALGDRQDHSSLGAIAKAMQDRDERVRLAALSALRAITGAQAVSIALHRLGTGSAKERGAVVDCLATQLRNDRSGKRGKLIKRLVIMVKAERPQTQKDAALVLERIGGVAAYTMLNALASARQGSEGAWMRRIEAILLKVGKPALKSLVQAIQYAQDGEAQARAAVAPLARIGKAAAPYMVDLLDWRKKYSHLTGILAAEVLRRIGRAAVPTLLPLLKDRRADRRLTGVYLVGSLGGPSAKGGLLRVLATEKDPAVLSATVRMLGDLKAKQAVKPILAALARDTMATPTSARYSAYRAALTSLKPAAAELIGALKSTQAQVRLVAAQVVGGAKTAGAAETLITLLEDQSTAVVAAAAWALGELKAAAATTPLHKLARHKDGTIRLHVVAALGKIGAKSSYSAIKGSTRKANVAVKITAALAFGRMANKRGKKTINQVGWLRLPVARAAAKWAKARIKGKATDGPVPTLCSLLRDQQLKCGKSHPALKGFDFVNTCRFGVVSAWASLLNAKSCDKLLATAERLGRKDRGVTLESYWDAAKKKRYQKEVLWAGLPHGRVQRWYPNGQQMASGRLMVGQRTGHWTTFWDSGKQRWDTFYAAGKKTGTWKRWYDDGTLREQGTLAKGRRTGTWLEHHENAQKSMELKYVAGKLEGKQVSFYSNGTKSGEALYKSGRREGAWQTWYQNGKKRSKGQYSGGLRSGHWIWWHKTEAAKREEGKFLKGIKTGTWKTYDKYGVVLETCQYGASGTPSCTK